VGAHDHALEPEMHVATGLIEEEVGEISNHPRLADAVGPAVGKEIHKKKKKIF
jgi:hypothetical protein